MARTLLFDPHDTVLDLRALDPYFQRVLGDRALRREWWMELVELALVDSVTDHYRSFHTLSGDALEMVARRHRLRLGPGERDEFLQTLNRLPAFPEALEALRRLKQSGFRLVALSNAEPEATRSQLEYAGLLDEFDEVISAAESKQLKPAQAPYRLAAQRLGQPPDQLRLVTAEPWDVRGASRNGLHTALVERSGTVLDPGLEPPEVMAADLAQLAERIVEVDMGPSFPG